MVWYADAVPPENRLDFVFGFFERLVGELGHSITSLEARLLIDEPSPILVSRLFRVLVPLEPSCSEHVVGSCSLSVDVTRSPGEDLRGRCSWNCSTKTNWSG